MALGREVVDLVGGCAFQNPVEIARVGQVAVVEEKLRAVNFRVFIQMVDPAGVEGGTAPHHLVDDVALT